MQVCSETRLKSDFRQVFFVVGARESGFLNESEDESLIMTDPRNKEKKKCLIKMNEFVFLSVCQALRIMNAGRTKSRDGQDFGTDVPVVCCQRWVFQNEEFKMK